MSKAETTVAGLRIIEDETVPPDTIIFAREVQREVYRHPGGGVLVEVLELEEVGLEEVGRVTNIGAAPAGGAE